MALAASAMRLPGAVTLTWSLLGSEAPSFSSLLSRLPNFIMDHHHHHHHHLHHQQQQQQHQDHAVGLDSSHWLEDDEQYSHEPVTVACASRHTMQFILFAAACLGSRPTPSFTTAGASMPAIGCIFSETRSAPPSILPPMNRRSN
ncbi:hypothetical protein KC317_g48 [Hortaea werneckii]|nr:hypothetical protein KC317_g48 [Hortaea werneckii]KAI7628655.1 hypothetical protein KC346_g52 [Hortaea werneckii]